MVKVLIVDDSSMTRNFHAYVLRSAGFAVIDASDGVEALEKLYTEGDIACIITDLNMPNMDGLTFIRRVRQEPLFADVPIIVVTTLDDATDRKEGIRAGANFYLTKPIQPSVLVESVRIAVGG
jgi:two-component system chemotaxis response regulator CheY|uniref:Response regulator n=1 Tax=Candidatus Caldatribacterium californiense TaxID=1454726 RepID=A0A7V3YHW0_9BACT